MEGSKRRPCTEAKQCRLRRRRPGRGEAPGRTFISSLTRGPSPFGWNRGDGPRRAASVALARSGAARRRRGRRRLAPCGVRVRARHGTEPVGQRVREASVGSSDLRAVQADQGTLAYGTDPGATDERPPPARPTGPPPCAYDPHPAEPLVRDKTPRVGHVPARPIRRQHRQRRRRIGHWRKTCRSIHSRIAPKPARLSGLRAGPHRGAPAGRRPRPPSARRTTRTAGWRSRRGARCSRRR